MSFDTQITPCLYDASRLSQTAEVLPLGDGCPDLLNGFWVFECGDIAQRLIKQDGAKRSAHVFARACLRKRGYNKEVGRHGGSAFF